MGSSQSTSKSEQKAEVYLTQQYSGTCNISCQNIASDIDIDIIGSTVKGDIALTQTCATNASCTIDSMSDALADVYFKARNTTNASNASNIFTGSIFNFDEAHSSSKQDIRQAINQSTNQSCDISNYNELSDVSIFALNSTIGGSIAIDQSSNLNADCKLSNTMKAAAYATGLAENEAQSGKDKKGSKFNLAGYIILIVAIVVVVFILSKLFTGHQASSEKSAYDEKVMAARGLAGCPGGLQPVLDRSTGRPIIDPRTMRPICPPYVPPAAASSSRPPVQIIETPVKIVFQDGKLK
jgi:hypothetical protein